MIGNIGDKSRIFMSHIYLCQYAADFMSEHYFRYKVVNCPDGRRVDIGNNNHNPFTLQEIGSSLFPIFLTALAPISCDKWSQANG
jgi:hypothetical protein